MQANTSNRNQSNQSNPRKSGTPFKVFERNPRSIKKELNVIFKSSDDANIITYSMAKFLLALRNVDIVNSYIVSVNYLNRKLHVSFKWINDGHTDMTFNLENKLIMASALRPPVKE